MSSTFSCFPIVRVTCSACTPHPPRVAGAHRARRPEHEHRRGSDDSGVRQDRPGQSCCMGTR
eukprot:6713784-Pyramimonas_sp.AAC.1